MFWLALIIFAVDAADLPKLQGLFYMGLIQQFPEFRLHNKYERRQM
jgi:hypothetical protein